MRKQIALLALLVALAPATANAWFFFFIPGSVTGAISDKLTGAEGDNCVGANAKVGDRITVPGRGTGIVKSLAGTSMRCTTNEFPIRALLDFSADANAGPSSTPVSSNSQTYRQTVALERPPVGEVTECVPMGSREGDKIRLRGYGEVLVKRIAAVNTQCGLVGHSAGTIQATIVATHGPQHVTAPQPPMAAEPSNLACVPAGVGPGDRTSAGDRQVEIVRIVRRGPPCDSRPEAPMIAEYREVTAAPAVAPAPTPAVAPPATSKLGFAHQGDPLQDKRSSLENTSPASESGNTAGQSEVARKLRELSGLLKDGVITQTEFDEKKKELIRSF